MSLIIYFLLKPNLNLINYLMYELLQGKFNYKYCTYNYLKICLAFSLFLIHQEFLTKEFGKVNNFGLYLY